MRRPPPSLATRFMLSYLKVYLISALGLLLLLNLGESGPHRQIVSRLAQLQLKCNWLAWREGRNQAQLEAWLESQGSLPLREVLIRDLPAHEARSLQLLPASQTGPPGYLCVPLEPLALLAWTDTTLTPLASYTRFYSPIRLALLLTGVVLVPLVVVWLTSRRVTRPLRTLEQASQSLARGDYSCQLDWPDSRELCHLTESFRTMAWQLEEREQLLRERNEKLEEVNQLKSQFLAMVSHELRTPLTAILGQSQMLLDDFKGPLAPAQRTTLEKIQSHVQVQIRLIEDLLDLSRMEAGRLKTECLPFSASDCVEEAMECLEPMLKAKNLRLHWQTQPGLQALGDFQRTRQILVNLLSNAIKFTPSGSLGVALKAGDTRLEFEVWDTGPGILEKDFGRIFEDFEQLQPQGATRGSGLGLAISRRLARLQGGELEVRSEPGSGAYFTLSLPRAED